MRMPRPVGNPYSHDLAAPVSLAVTYMPVLVKFAVVRPLLLTQTFRFGVPAPGVYLQHPAAFERSDESEMLIPAIRF